MKAITRLLACYFRMQEYEVKFGNNLKVDKFRGYDTTFYDYVLKYQYVYLSLVEI